MENGICRSCEYCKYYAFEEIGDSDFGALYSDTRSCLNYFDLDQDDEVRPDFDRTIPRSCCKLEFWLVMEKDEVLKESFDNEFTNDGNFNKTFKLFEEKYK